MSADVPELLRTVSPQGPDDFNLEKNIIYHDKQSTNISCTMYTQPSQFQKEIIKTGQNNPNNM